MLLKDVDRAILADFAAYAKSLGKKAEAAFKKKFNKAAKAEVETHRATLKALRESPALSKEMAAAQGMPALQALDGLLLVHAEEVAKDDEGLCALRDRLIEFDGYAGKCRAILPDKAEKEKAKSPDKGKKNNAGKPAFEAPEPGPQTLADRLRRIEVIASLRPMLEATNMTGAIAVLEANEEIAGELDPLEAEGVLYLNVLRLLSGSKPLKIDVRLCAAARDHARDMKTKGFFSHQSPLPGKASFTDRAKNFGTSATAENIAYGQQTVSQVNMGWFHSPGHHKNMLNPAHSFIGLGHFETFWTQMFR